MIRRSRLGWEDLEICVCVFTKPVQPALHKFLAREFVLFIHLPYGAHLSACAVCKTFVVYSTIEAVEMSPVDLQPKGKKPFQ